MVVGLVVLLLLCPCLGLAGWAAWRSVESDVSEAGPAAGAPASPSQEPAGTPPGTPGGGQRIAVGDCVVNDGTDTDAELREVACGSPGSYRVLLRISGTTDGDRCRTRMPEATANYVQDNPIDALDYVLCLRESD
ncbi:LppU/SCO3897 family protein [Micromonospora nigra]|uniref:LppU/SCO3897 family protein n=1 Tax=Micromonospora nigra TaxID=145857 RepID=UPI000B84E513